MLIPIDQLRESSFYQYILEEGRKEGRQQVREEAREKGRQEGRQEGVRDILRPLLEQRFGALPDWASEKIEAADLKTLENWCTSIIDAASLEDVLAT